MDAKEVIKILKQNGFTFKSQSGSHKNIKEDKVVIVPVHGKKDLPMGTIKSIEKQSGLKLR